MNNHCRPTIHLRVIWLVLLTLFLSGCVSLSQFKKRNLKNQEIFTREAIQEMIKPAGLPSAQDSAVITGLKFFVPRLIGIFFLAGFLWYMISLSQSLKEEN